jgi:phage terminase large subunit-like protein
MPKKSGKTTLAAAIGSYYFEQGPPGSEIYCLANDLEQAQSRVYTDIVYDQDMKGNRTQKFVIPGDNGTFVKALASEYRSVAGGRQALTLWDELWGYTSDRSRLLWAEMTPPPTVRSPLRIIVTYAGFEGESDLLWDLYERNFLDGEVVPELADIVDENGEPVCRSNGSVFVYWDTTPRMPWQTEKYYGEQMATMRPTDFLRLHRNQWVTTAEEFIPIAYWDAAATKLDGPLNYRLDDPARELPISVGVDAGIKHDCTAVVGTYFDYVEGRVGVAFHRIWYPPKEGRMDLDVVDDYIMEMSRQLNIAAVVYDPTQLHQVMTNLEKKGIPVIEFPQTVNNMTACTQNLYDLIMNGSLDAYENDVLRDHIKFTAVEIKGRGQKMVKPSQTSTKKIDGAVALAMSAYDAIKRGGVDTTIPIRIESPFGDVSQFSYKSPVEAEMERVLPPELRG